MKAAHQYHYKDRLITSYGQFETIFAENNVPESIVLMRERTTQFTTGAILGGVGSVGGLYTAFVKYDLVLNLASFGVFLVGLNQMTRSFKKVPKAVDSYNNNLKNRRNMSFDPLLKSDQLGNHVGISIGF
jgi:hypothetical protein